jgi:streptomycin 6-kinase
VTPYAEHPGLAWMRGSPEGRRWLAVLPDRVERCRERWSLALGEPFAYAYASLAMPVRLPDGSDAVLKLQFPDRESEHEGAALAHWAGRGAVVLLDADAPERALLLERCQPGTPLSTVDPEVALDVLAGLVGRLTVPAGAPFRSLADEAADWAASLPVHYERAGAPFDRRLLDAVLDLLSWLPATQRGDPVLLHQDLHADNVLRAGREPWLAIDPKPLVGEREFAVAPIVRGGELGHSRAAVRRRLDRLVGELGLDRDRATGWTAAQTLAWASEGDEVITDHIEVVAWLLDG